ncbi:hypothetical protein HB662_19760 [Roseomonas frigidaquae]|uniref:Uncharacterized protein n=1 Tax=Falsiroseomonas frigidaquae TaxID=487318 RepID=A0ABX1F433_9PROT|nr:hypothetical protein [Falsiroseomonas frigidaquae]NKE47026.1 hypothetical protein [Falsiroseomonas frigidaquae]
MVLLAEARIGAELTAAQARGAVATQAEHGRGVQASARASGTCATLAEIGIPSRRVSEMNKLAQAGEQAIREVAAAAGQGRGASRPEEHSRYLQAPQRGRAEGL